MRAIPTLNGQFHLNGVVIDPWQAVHLIQRLRAKGVPVTEFTFSDSNITKLTNTLYSLFKDRNIGIFEYTPLIQELMTAKII